MALEERGRRITLKADISQLKSAFNKVNAIARQSATELRKIGNALRFDPHNIALLTRHQKELNRLIAQNHKKIGNLKKQIAAHTESGDVEAVRKLTNKLEIARSENNRFKASLKETNKTLANLGNIQALAKLESELKQSKANVESLNKALKLDVGNISAAATKFRELKSQLDNLDRQALILIQDLKKIDIKTNPQGFNKIKSKLEETRAEAKHTREELKKLGDTKFSPALVQIEKLDQELKKSRETSKSLKRELEFKPRDSLLKSLKLEEARNELTKTREKIKLLKSELSRVKTTDNREEFTKLNLKIAESERHTKELIRSFNILNAAKLNGARGALTSFGHSLQQNAKAMRDAGRNFTLGYSLPVTYGMGRVLNEFRQTDDGLRRVAAAASDGVKEKFTTSFREVEASARESSKGTVYSVKQVASGMEELIKANWKAADAQREVIHVMNLAKVEGMDLAQATEIVADGLASFGLKANETARFTDVLTMASIKSTTDITKMGETLKYVAPVAGTLGYTIEDTATAISIMANNGIKASVAGTSLRAGLTNLVKPSKQARAALAEIGFSMTDANGKTKPLIQVISELREKTQGMTEAQKAHFAASVFGKTAMSGWMAILNASDTSVKELTNSIKNSKGATKEMADQLTSGVGGAFDRFKASVSNTSYEVGKSLAPALKSVIDGATKMVTSLGNASDGTKIFVTSLVGITAVIPPLTWAIGGAITQFQRFATFLKLAFATPIGLAISGTIALTVALQRYFSSTNEAAKAKDKIKEANEGIANSFEKIAAGVRTAEKEISESQGYFETLYGSSDKAAQRMKEIPEEIQDIQAKISDILRKYSDDRENISQEDLQRLKDYNNKRAELYKEQTQIVNQRLGDLNTAVKEFVKNDSLTDEQYLATKNKLTKDLNSTYEEAQKNASDYYVRMLAENAKLPPELRKSNEEINREYQKMLTDAKTSYDESVQALERRNLQQSKLMDEFFRKTAEVNNKIQSSEKRHQEELEKIREAGVQDAQGAALAMEQENERYYKEQQKHKEELKAVFESMNQDEIGRWANSIKTAKEKGRELTAEEKATVKAMIEAYDGMDTQMQEKVKKALEAVGFSIDDMKTILGGKSNESAFEMMRQLQSGINDGKPGVKTEIDTVAQELSNVIGAVNLFPNGVSIMNALGSGIFGGKPSVDTNISSTAQSIVDKVKNTDLAPAGREKSEQLGRGIKSADRNVWDAAQQTANYGKDGAGSVSFTGVGAAMTIGMANGANSQSNTLFSTLRGLASQAWQAAKAALGINSPSRVFKREVGHWIAPGIAEGVVGNADTLFRSIKGTMTKGVKVAKDFNFSDKLGSIANFSSVNDYAIQHTVSQNNIVVETLNTLISKINDLELRSDIYLDGDKVGNATYKRHEVIDRRLGLV